MSLRDANIIIIEVSRTAVRAGIGLFDLLKTPSIEIPARVGLRRGASGDPHAPTKDDTTIASTSRAASAMPQPLKAAVNDYLVGTQLDDALAAGQDIIVSWPFAKGDVADWTQAEALWKFILFNQLQRRRVQNESPVMLSIFAGLSRTSYERVCQMFFERFNVAGFAIVERPLSQMYAANGLSGTIVDIGDYDTDITPIYEGFLMSQGRCRVAIGLKDCEVYLAHLLRSNQNVMSTLSPPENPLPADVLQMQLVQLAQHLWMNGYIKVPSDGETAIIEDEGITDIAAVVVAGKEKAVIESGLKKKATAKQSAAEQARAREIEALDLITVQFGEYSLKLGKERHRMCEPLFDPKLLNGLTGLPLRQDEELVRPLQDMVAHANYLIDIDRRPYIWQGVMVTGDITRYVKGLGVALQSRLAPYMCNPDTSMDLQPRMTRVLNIPEFYAEYRETGNGYASFLGSSIAAKIIFNDNNSRSYVSKSEYTAKGPHSIIELTAALL